MREINILDLPKPIVMSWPWPGITSNDIRPMILEAVKRYCNCKREGVE